MNYEKTYLRYPVLPIYGNRIHVVTRYGSIMPSIPVDLERYLRIGQNYNFTTNGYAPNPGTEFAAQFFGFGLNPQFGRVMLFKKMTVNDKGKPDKNGKFHLEGPFEYPSRSLSVTGRSTNNSTTKFVVTTATTATTAKKKDSPKKEGKVKLKVKPLSKKNKKLQKKEVKEAIELMGDDEFKKNCMNLRKILIEKNELIKERDKLKEKVKKNKWNKFRNSDRTWEIFDTKEKKRLKVVENKIIVLEKQIESISKQCEKYPEFNEMIKEIKDSTK